MEFTVDDIKEHIVENMDELWEENNGERAYDVNVGFIDCLHWLGILDDKQCNELVDYAVKQHLERLLTAKINKVFGE